MFTGAREAGCHPVPPALSTSVLFFGHTRHVPTTGLCSGCARPPPAYRPLTPPEQAHLWALTRPTTPTCGIHTPNSPSAFEPWTEPLLFVALCLLMNRNVIHPRFPSTFCASFQHPCRQELLDKVDISSSAHLA